MSGEDQKSPTTSQAIGSILAKLCYKAADELGELWGEKVAAWRKKNAGNILYRADHLYEERGVQQKSFAHPRLAHKILEEGSWNEEDLVQDMWAGLLVSSCSPGGQDDSNLIFINILSQLTVLEAKILGASPNCVG